jgi:hypothetical protein
MGVESQVSHIADADRVTYRDETADYFPGVTDAAPSMSIPRVRERIPPAPSLGQSGPALRGEADMSSGSGSKRPRLDVV